MSEKINIKSMNPDTLIELLKKMGLSGDVELFIVNDVKNGFELNEDESINVIDYLAWLIIKSGKVRVE